MPQLQGVSYRFMDSTLRAITKRLIYWERMLLVFIYLCSLYDAHAVKTIAFNIWVIIKYYHRLFGFFVGKIFGVLIDFHSKILMETITEILH